MWIPRSDPLCAVARPARSRQRTTSIVLPSALIALALAQAPAWSLSFEEILSVNGTQPADNLGISVSTAGDVNGDGYDDVIVGTYADPPFAYVYWGGPAMGVAPGMALTRGDATGYFGSAVSSAGDVNGDGYDDIIVGQLGENRAYVYYGAAEPDTVPDLILSGVSGGNFGQSVAAAGDFNHDGFSDFMVGATYAGGEGEVYLYFGGPWADAIADRVFAGAADPYDDKFGYALAPLGDVNGDGHDDIIVGEDDGGEFHQGLAYVYFGGPAADTVPDLTLDPGPNGGRFGVNVDGVGDLNGDGHRDFMVSDPSYYTPELGSGVVLVYYGGPHVDETEDLLLTPAAAFEDGANCIMGAGAGDVNADGYADIAITSNPSQSPIEDVLFVYLGGYQPDSVPDLAATIGGSSQLFKMMGTAGDVNGDGYADVIVGTRGLNEEGNVTVLSIFPYHLLAPNGGDTWVAGEPATIRWDGHDIADIDLSLDAGFTWTTIEQGVGGEHENVATVSVTATPTDWAKVRVRYSGHEPSRSTSDATDGVFRIVQPTTPPDAAYHQAGSLVGEESDFLGRCVASAGDFNGDGYDDAVVGMPRGDGTGPGVAFLFYGGPRADAVADLVLTQYDDDDYFGSAIGPAGDLNRDGYPDIVVGAPWGGTGRAFVYLGGADPDSIADLVLTGEAPSDAFGTAVAAAGDMNGDGYDDLIIGAPQANSGGADRGRVYIFLGDAILDPIPDRVHSGYQDYDYLGSAVTSVGDLNGDGYDDVAVGAKWDDASGLNAGAVYVTYGGPILWPVPHARITGEAPGDYFGVSVAGADVNGDGFGDLIVGADHSDAGGNDAGRAYVYFGGVEPDTIPDLTITGDDASDFFGGSVAGAGDVNDDGYPDFIIGAIGSDIGVPNAGRAYLYYGGVAPDEVADLEITQSQHEALGASVSSAGDLDGNGFSDLVIGAPGSEDGGIDSGRAYFYLFERHHVTGPEGGETWNVGATETISWRGAEPADVWLSVDGGTEFELLLGDAGGDATNAIQILVPHRPTRFARVRLTPANPSLSGQDQSDSLFTIDASIILQFFRTGPPREGLAGTELRWTTEPGPEDLAGYRIERDTGGNGENWETLVPLTSETSFRDPEGGPGMRYRLTAVNGLGEAFLLGTSVMRPPAPLAARPVPYRGGEMVITFATPGGLGGGSSRTTVALFDVAGRLVRSIADDDYPAGYQQATWDGRDESGARVGAGIYLLRTISLGNAETLKLTVLR